MKKLITLMLFSLTAIVVRGQCLFAPFGAWPSGEFSVTCNGPGWSTGDAWPGEYTFINIVAGNTYTFSSSVSTDFITISNFSGTVSYLTGTGSVTGTATITQTVRFYRHLNPQCGTSQVGRTITVTCSAGGGGGDITFYFGESTTPESETLGDQEVTYVAVRTIGFQNVGSFQFTIAMNECFRSLFPPDIIGVSNIHPALVLHSYDLDPAGNYVTFTWFTSTSLTLTNSTKLFDVEVEGPGFGNNGCCPHLVFTDIPIEIRAYNNQGLEMNVEAVDVHEFCEAPYRICGCITREIGDPVRNVTVSLYQANVLIEQDITGPDGCYEFLDLVPGAEYAIVPAKNLNAKNGIDQNDASLVAQYAGNKPVLSSPYKKVAADVITDDKVRSNDAQLVARVSAISVPNDFSPQPSWKFVPSDYVFPTISVTESYNDNFPMTRIISNLNGDYCDENFIGIKMGDVNLSANPQNVTGDQNIETRSILEEIFRVESFTVVDSVFHLNIVTSGFENIKDFQTAFSWDPDILEYVDYTKDDFELPVSSLAGILVDGGPISVEEGRLYLGWFDFTFNPNGISIPSGEQVAEIRFKLKDKTASIIEFERDTLVESFYTNLEDRRIPIEIGFGHIDVDLMTSRVEPTNDQSKFMVYPNITSGPIHIEATIASSYHAVLLDMHGKEITRGEYWGHTVMDVGHLVPGMYVLQINEYSSGLTHVFRIIKT